MGGAKAHLSRAGDVVNCESAPAGDEVEWCVDLGCSITAMTTAEVRAALCSGELGRDARVWGEGLACWMRADEVPELAQAFSGADWAATPPALEIDVEGSDRSARDLRVLGVLAPAETPAARENGAPRAKAGAAKTGRRFRRADWIWVSAGAVLSLVFVVLSLMSGTSQGRGSARVAEGNFVRLLAERVRSEVRAAVPASADTAGGARVEPGQKRRRSTQKAAFR